MPYKLKSQHQSPCLGIARRALVFLSVHVVPRSFTDRLAMGQLAFVVSELKSFRYCSSARGHIINC
jgi:hypothetical protein